MTSTDGSRAVSVALCTYNGARFVAAQVRSILEQTTPVTEIVVSDDGSTDDTMAVLESTLAAWTADGGAVPRVRILRNAEPLGVTANFEMAIAACTGPVIALCDQDDVWHPERIERLTAAFGDDDARPELVFGDARLVGDQGEDIGTTLFSALGVSDQERDGVQHGQALAVLMRRNVVTGATAMIRSSLARRAIPFPTAWVHDEWLAMVAATRGDLGVVDEALTDYRQHPGNQIGASTLTLAVRFRRLVEPRTERNARLLERARQLAERMPSLDASGDGSLTAAADGKLRHEIVRSTLPAARFRRLPAVWREWRTGRYRSYGLGIQDALRDLIQPV